MKLLKQLEKAVLMFQKSKKEEYYGTPLYLYNVDTKVDTEKRQVKLFLKKTKFDGFLNLHLLPLILLLH